MMKLLPVLLALTAVAGCSSDPKPTSGEDTGIVQCRAVAKSVSDESGDDAMPTDDQLDKVKANYEGSQFSDVKRAGLAYLAAFKGYVDTPGSVPPVEILTKRDALFATCRAHGVVISEPSTAPMTVPTRATLPDVPMPTNPYSN